MTTAEDFTDDQLQFLELCRVRLKHLRHLDRHVRQLVTSPVSGWQVPQLFMLVQHCLYSVENDFLALGIDPAGLPD